MADPTDLAMAHLEDAETAIMSYMAAVSAVPEEAPDSDVPDVMPMLIAVLRSVSRAAGVLETDG